MNSGEFLFKEEVTKEVIEELKALTKECYKKYPHLFSVDFCYEVNKKK